MVPAQVSRSLVSRKRVRPRSIAFETWPSRKKLSVHHQKSCHIQGRFGALVPGDPTQIGLYDGYLSAASRDTLVQLYHGSKGGLFLQPMKDSSETMCILCCLGSMFYHPSQSSRDDRIDQRPKQLSIAMNLVLRSHEDVRNWHSSPHDSKLTQS